MSLVPSALLAAALWTLAPAEDGLTLRWAVPPECPGVSAVRSAFERHAKNGHAPVEIDGTVTQDGPQYVLELEIVGPAGRERRRVEANTCEALADTAGLLGAVASDPEPRPPEPFVPPIEPELEPPEPDVPETQTPAPEVQTVLDTTDAPAPPRPPSKPSPVRLLVRADGLVQTLRLLPRVVGGGVGGAVGVMGSRWRAELRGQYFAPQPRDYADLVVGGSFDLWTLGVAGCWAPERGRLSFPLCGGFEAGSLRGRANAVEAPGRAQSAFAGLTGDASLVFAPIPRVGLRAEVGGVLSLRRPKFHVRDQDLLFQAGRAALRGSLGVEVRFL